MKKLILLYLIALSYDLEAQGLIHEFNFNGTLNNKDNTISFTGTENFVEDRMGNPNSAQRLNNKSLKAIIDNIPQNNNPRTISLWVKLNDISAANYIWGYGTAYRGQYFGLLQQEGSDSPNSILSLAGWGVGNDIIVNTLLVSKTWYNYSVTFDGQVSKIYIDGNLIKLVKNVSRNTKGTIFKLGEMNTTLGIKADVDDLKIYNLALSDQEIMNLYNNSKPFVNKNPFPEPTNILTAIKDISIGNPAQSNFVKKSTVLAENNTLALKKIEIFSQGEKVTTNNTKEINLNDLPDGTYLLKIGPAKQVKKVPTK